MNKVGIDLDSYDLWKDYLDFYKGWTPGSNFELQQKNESIRKLYRRCLVIPNAKIETMWADYRKWENENSSPNSASKFIADLSTAYMEVRPWNTEWQNATGNLLRRKLVPFSPLNDTSDIVKPQVLLWFRWIDLEKQNKLNLSEQALTQRIEHVYRRAISMLPFVPELWYKLSQYLLSVDEEGTRGTCISLLADGLVLNPTSFLITFRLSELYEKDNSFTKARDTYEGAIKLLSEEHYRIEAKVEELKAQAADATKDASVDTANDNGYDSNDDEPAPQPVFAYTESQATEIGLLQGRLEELAHCVTLLYIKLMALCKRAQGIKEVRSVFKQRKNFKDMGFELYVENALHEYYSDNKKTADKIFDLAMKLFSKSGAFLYAYLDYLMLSNSIESLKVIFEVAVTSLLKEIAVDKETLEIATHNLVLHNESQTRLRKSQKWLKKIIKRYVYFASNYLDLDSVLSLTKRFKQYFPETDDLTLFSDRYKLGHFNAITKYDLADNAETLTDLDDEDEPSQKRRKIALNIEDSETSNALGRSDNYSLGSSMPSTTGFVQPQQQQQPVGFVGEEIYTLLQFLPNAGCFGPKSEHLFNSAKLVELFSDAILPGEQ